MDDSWDGLLGKLVAWRGRDYRSDLERTDARVETIESVLEAMLEKLRDAADRPVSELKEK